MEVSKRCKHILTRLVFGQGPKIEIDIQLTVYLATFTIETMIFETIQFISVFAEDFECFNFFAN